MEFWTSRSVFPLGVGQELERNAIEILRQLEAKEEVIRHVCRATSNVNIFIAALRPPPIRLGSNRFGTSARSMEVGGKGDSRIHSQERFTHTSTLQRLSMLTRYAWKGIYEILLPFVAIGSCLISSFSKQTLT